jgi:hypothetical protein
VYRRFSDGFGAGVIVMAGVADRKVVGAGVALGIGVWKVAGAGEGAVA